jgi:hypothetical protein
MATSIPQGSARTFNRSRPDRWREAAINVNLRTTGGRNFHRASSAEDKWRVVMRDKDRKGGTSYFRPKRVSRIYEEDGLRGLEGTEVWEW